jgi:hypothetical protein
MRPLNLNTHPIIFRVLWGLRKLALLALLLAALFFCLVDITWKEQHAELHHMQAFVCPDPASEPGEEMSPEPADGHRSGDAYSTRASGPGDHHMADGARHGPMRGMGARRIPIPTDRYQVANPI